LLVALYCVQWQEEAVISNHMGFLDGIGDSVSKFVEGALSEAVKGLEKKVDQQITHFKKQIMKSLFEMVFFLLSLVFLVWGGILILSNYFLIEYMFIGAGFLFLYAGLMVRLMK